MVNYLLKDPTLFAPSICQLSLWHRHVVLFVCILSPLLFGNFVVVRTLQVCSWKMRLRNELSYFDVNHKGRCLSEV